MSTEKKADNAIAPVVCENIAYDNIVSVLSMSARKYSMLISVGVYSTHHMKRVVNLQLGGVWD